MQNIRQVLHCFCFHSSSRIRWTTLCPLQAPNWSASKPGCVSFARFWWAPVGTASSMTSSSFPRCWRCSPACLTHKSEPSDTPAPCLVSSVGEQNRVAYTWLNVYFANQQCNPRTFYLLAKCQIKATNNIQKHQSHFSIFSEFTDCGFLQLKW